MNQDHAAARPLLPRPAAIARFEAALGRAIPVHPNWLSAWKLLGAAPLLLLAAAPASPIAGATWALVGGLALLAGLDYLDGVVAREQDLCTGFGRVWDRVTDYPLLIGLGTLCTDVLPLVLVAAKALLDVFVLVLFSLGKGSTENRVRTVLTWATLVGLLALAEGWLPGLVSSGVVTVLLLASIGLTAAVATNQLGLLPRLAAGLSGSAGGVRPPAG